MNDVCLMFNQTIPIFAIYLFAHLAVAGFGFPYFNQSLKFLQGFLVFNFLWYRGPCLRCQESDRLDNIVCHFYIFPPELHSLTREIMLWFLKVKYLLRYFTRQVIFYLKHFCYKNVKVSLMQLFFTLNISVRRT